MKRRHMGRRSSKRLFKRTANRMHPKNGLTVMRGGYRI